MKKQTMLNEPDEFPPVQPTPEIQQPSDPKAPEIPPENPVREPQELPPGEIPKPEIGQPDR